MTKYRHFIGFSLLLLVLAVPQAVWGSQITVSGWAADIISNAADSGIRLDVENYLEPISRRDMCKLVSDLIRNEMGEELYAYLQEPRAPFVDVPSYDPYVAVCYNAGLVSGLSPDTFSPSGFLTREQAAVIIINTVKYLESMLGLETQAMSDTKPAYADAHLIAPWAEDAVAAAYVYNLMQGDASGFNPKGTITCEQAVTIVYNAYGYFGRFMGGSYTPEEIDKIKYIASEYNRIKKVESDDIYIVPPSARYPYGEGVVKREYIQAAIDNVNLARYIAGVPANVAYGEEYTGYAQAAALIMDALGTLSHNPPRPSGMEDSIYTKGAKGASASNIAYNSGLAGSVWSYMHDSDAYNIDRVGHRRWILNPGLGKTSFGFSGVYSAMYVFDESNTAKFEHDAITWPSSLFPMQEMNKNLAWSVSLDESYFYNVDADNISVTLTRERDNKTIIVSPQTQGNGAYFNINKENYGYFGPAIIFRPPYELEGLIYLKNDVFNVTISGLAKPFSYQVKLFDCKDVRKLG